MLSRADLQGNRRSEKNGQRNLYILYIIIIVVQYSQCGGSAVLRMRTTSANNLHFNQPHPVQVDIGYPDIYIYVRMQ